MNALVKSARVALPRAKTFTQARSASNNTFKKDFDLGVWSSDPGAYPVIGIVVFACSFCTWRIFDSTRSSDVRITPEKRQNLIRNRD